MKDNKERGLAERVSLVAKGELEQLPLSAKAAIGKHLLSKKEEKEEREVANEYCRLVAETAVSLFIECWPERP